MITRRLALFRIAATAAVTTTAAVPAAISAVQPKTPEDPALIRFGRWIERLDAIRQHRAKAKADALAAYERTRPVVPTELLVTVRTKDIARAEQEYDWDCKTVWPSDPCKPPLRYHTFGNIRDSFDIIADDGDCLTDRERADRDLLLRLLPIAQRYEREKEAAIVACGIHRAANQHYRAASALERVAWELAAIPAQTPEGITIKARAYEALATCGTEHRHKAAQIIGPTLAEDICRVLSEGSEA